MVAVATMCWSLCRPYFLDVSFFVVRVLAVLVLLALPYSQNYCTTKSQLPGLFSLDCLTYRLFIGGNMVDGDGDFSFRDYLLCIAHRSFALLRGEK